MRTREVYLVEDETLGVAATRIFNLDLAYPLTRLDIEVVGIYFSDEPDCNPLISRCITKIEIVDGSDVLFSMDMREAQALQYYTHGKQPETVICARAAGSNRSHAVIHFGRDDSDQDWMLDPKKFINPQLKITYNLPVGVDGGWTAGLQTLSVKATVCEEPIRAPVGFLMGKQIYEWAKGTTGDETIDMPRDYLYRLALMRCYDFAGGYNVEFTNFKLSCDIDRFVPFNIDCRDLRLKEYEEYGIMYVHTVGESDGAAGFGVWTPFGNTRGGYPMAPDPTQAPVVTGFAPRRVWVVDTAGNPIDDNAVIECGAFGTLLNDCCPYKFGNLRDQEEFFDPTPYQSVRLIVTQGGTALLLSAIVLQQLRNY